MPGGRRHRRRGIVAWLALLAAVFLIPCPAARAQLPGLGAPDATAPPAGVRRLGLVETTPVAFDGVPLFEIASPLVADRARPDGVPVEVRARQVELHLNKLREAMVAADTGSREGDPTALESGALTVEVRAQDGQVSLVARGVGLTSPRNLVTVTTTDAEWQQTPREELAGEWSGAIRAALSGGVRARRPDAARARWATARGIAVAVPLLHLALFGINLLLARRQNVLRREIERRRAATEGEASARAAAAADPGEDPDDGPGRAAASSSAAVEEVRLFGHAVSPERRFRLLAFVRWLLLWIVVAAWVVGATLVLFLFPQTRRFAAYLTATPLIALIALFVAGLVNRVTDLLVDRALEGWKANRLADRAEDSSRAAARISTLSGVLRALKLVLVYSVAFAWVLSRLEVVHWSVVTLGAVAALALSFALQSLLKDVVTGVLILIEDQYAVGDTVTLAGVTGVVEYMNLRMTRVRAADGRLVTVPNSAVTTVENFSRNWSVATVQFDVPSSADADAALARAREVAREMAREPEWRGVVLDPDQWSGISALSPDAATVEIAVRTRPLRSGAVGRELRRRLRNATDREGADPGYTPDNARTSRGPV